LKVKVASGGKLFMPSFMKIKQLVPLLLQGKKIRVRDDI